MDNKERVQQTWIRKNPKKTILLLLLLFSLVFFELLLRIFPNRYTLFNSSVGYINEEITHLIPHQAASWNKDCFQINHIKTNSLGFRDREWDNLSDFKIAVLGDSMIEALQVGDGQNATELLENLLGISTLNFGISGYGTLHEYLGYKKFVKQFNPQIVLLFFTTSNDIRDNSCRLRKKLGLDLYTSCGDIEDGVVKIKNTKRTLIGNEVITSKFKNFIKTRCKTFMFFKTLSKDAYLWEKIKNYFTSPSKGNNGKDPNNMGTIKNNQEYNIVPLAKQIYLPTRDTYWEEAWLITEFFLDKLNKELEESGTKLIVVNIADYLRITKEWKKDIQNYLGTDQLPERFDPFYPVIKLEEITHKLGIKLLKLEPYFLKYRDDFNLSPPYFSYRCDSHWNPLGHFLAANIVSRYLLKNKLVVIENKKAALRKIENNLRKSPLEILGEEPYKEIYQNLSGGVFKGEI